MSKVVIQAIGPQRDFLYSILEDTVTEQIAYGGARGGGKTWCSCLAMIIRRLKYPNTKGLMLRQLQDAADENLGTEIKKVLTQLGLPQGPGGIQWMEYKKHFRFPNGSILKLGYCKQKNDWEKYQGQEFTDICFEEAGQWDEKVFLDIVGSNRTGDANAHSKVWLTFNPGGVGNNWIKKRFINEKTKDPRTKYIKALLRDNLAMLVNDPGYRDRVLGRLPEWRRKQWEDGDYDAIEGQFFNYDESKLFQKVSIPYWAKVYAGVDAGFYPSSFAAVWVAKWRDEETKALRLHVFKELKGQRWNVHQQAMEAKAIERLFADNFSVQVRYADTSAWKQTEQGNGSSSTVSYMWASYGFPVAKTYSKARTAGWALTRTIIDEGILTIDPSLMALNEEMRTAQHDSKSDDIKDGSEDHLLDALRYCIVSIFGGTVPTKEDSRYFHMIKKATDKRPVLVRG